MINWVKETDIRKIWMISIGFGFVILLLVGFVGTVLYDGNLPGFFPRTPGILVGIAFLFPGLAQIYKQESPGGFRGIIKGRVAIIIGIVWVVFCLSMILIVVFT